MPAIEDFDCEGVLTLGALVMSTPAWAVLGDEDGQGGLIQLWLGGDKRGDDRILPTETGVIPYPRRITATRYDLRLIVTGDVDNLGAPYADPRLGLETNLGVLQNYLVDSADSVTQGTIAGSLVTVAGTYAADVHVLGIQTVRYHLSAVATIFEGLIQISVPAGRFYYQ